MADEIVNRVANSSLVTFDLEEIYPPGERVDLDISRWLFQGILLREKDFRAEVDGHDWAAYRDKYVALNCSTEAIIPAWAFMLITTRLQPHARLVVQGDQEALETAIYYELLEALDLESFRDKPVIIKGCSAKPVPPNAYLRAASKIQTVARSVMYGEACSSVPLFKRK